MLEKLLTIKEAAPLLGWEVSTIYNKISHKKMPLPFIKLPGGNIKFKPSEIEKYLERRTIRPVK